ncbi:phosphatidate cytidylyltransferase, partial [Escherichia coli]|nr:phosphatidate cytidylyltransferase [Escherichia coli]
MYYIREQDGFLLILIVLATVISDTGAYLIGSFFGKHKLAPILSPNKTIEGSLGGVLASGFLIFIIVSLFPFLPMTPVVGGFIAIIIAIASQFGDLIESGMKREFNVKDTGTILPGHGGILDRFDSLIFATTLA